MKKIYIAFIIILLIISAVYIINNYNNTADNSSFNIANEKVFFSMNTIVKIIYEQQDNNKINAIIEKMNNTAAQIKEDEKKLSSMQPYIPVRLSEDFINVFKKAKMMSELSNGIYDPTSITVAELYGFPDKTFNIPEKEILEQAKKNAGIKYINFDGRYFVKEKNTHIDLSASSKGYIVDKTVQNMRNKGMKNFLVNAGGDTYADGMKNGKYKYKIYIEKPDTKNDYLSIISLSNKAVATSGNYEKFFMHDNKRITHFFKGVVFEPVNNYQSVSVIADSTQEADTLSTFYYMLSIDEIKEYCTTFKTPVLIYTLDNNTIKLCKWEEYEYLK